ncbi:MAG: methyltransferase domain-containing protein [Candidatus Altiarchaeota archaeon]
MPQKNADADKMRPPELNIVERPLSAEIEPALLPKLLRYRRISTEEDGYLRYEGGFRSQRQEVYETLKKKASSGERPVLLVIGPGNADDSFTAKFLFAERILLIGADIEEYPQVRRRREIAERLSSRWGFLPLLGTLRRDLGSTLRHDAIGLSAWKVPESKSEDGSIRDDLVREWTRRAKTKSTIPGFDHFILRSIEDFTLPAQVDIVQSTFVLYDAADTPRALENVLNSLKPGGKALIDCFDLACAAFTRDERKAIDEAHVQLHKETYASKLVATLGSQGYVTEVVPGKTPPETYFRITSQGLPCSLREFSRLEV